MTLNFTTVAIFAFGVLATLFGWMAMNILAMPWPNPIVAILPAAWAVTFAIQLIRFAFSKEEE